MKKKIDKEQSTIKIGSLSQPLNDDMEDILQKQKKNMDTKGKSQENGTNVKET